MKHKYVLRLPTLTSFLVLGFLFLFIYFFYVFTLPEDKSCCVNSALISRKTVDLRSKNETLNILTKYYISLYPNICLLNPSRMNPTRFAIPSFFLFHLLLFFFFFFALFFLQGLKLGIQALEGSVLCVF